MPPVTFPSFDTLYGVKEAELCNLALARIGSDIIRDTTEESKQGRACRSVYDTTRKELLRQWYFGFAYRSYQFPENEDYPYDKNGYSYAYPIDPALEYSCVNVLGEYSLTACDPEPDGCIAGMQIQGSGIPERTRILSVDGTTINIDRATTGAVSSASVIVSPLKILGVGEEAGQGMVWTRSIIKYVKVNSPSFGDVILTDQIDDTDDDGVNLLRVGYIDDIINPDAFDPLFKDALVLRIASKINPSLGRTPSITNQLMGEFAQIIRLASNTSSQEREIDGSDSYLTDERGI